MKKYICPTIEYSEKFLYSLCTVISGTENELITDGNFDDLEEEY